MEILINRLKINYIKKGRGKNVLIIPGWGTTIDTYSSLIESISSYACVYTLDMPGCGKSDEPKNSFCIDDYCNFIIDFLEKLNIKEVDLIGHSNGGRIIIKLINNNDLNIKINKIILIGSSGIKHKMKVDTFIKIKFYKLGKIIIKRVFPSLFNKFIHYAGSSDYRNASPIMRETMVKIINEDVLGCLPNIIVPTLLIWGEKDTDTPVEDAYIMNKLIINSKIVIVKNCSHYVFLEKSLYVNSLVKKFLGG